MPALRPDAVRPSAPRRRPPHGVLPARAAALAAVAALGLVACSSADPGAAPAEPVTADATAATDDGFPLTLTNCGVEVTLEAPPGRIVAIKSTAIEAAVVLGAGDRVVGTGFPDGPLPEEYAEAAADLPLLSDRVPSAEVVLETRPDLVMAGWESALTAEGAGDRAALAGLGVATYVSPAACKDPAHRPARLTWDDVFAEVVEIGTLLGERPSAELLAADQEQAIGMLAPDDRALTALWYSSGEDVPYVGAGIGAPQLLMDTVGLENIAAGVEDTWTPFSWEQVAEDDPDVIVLVDAEWNTAADKRERLASNPATANLTAVREERYLVVPFTGTEAGVGTVPTALELARQLTTLDAG